MTYKGKSLWKHKTPRGEISYSSEYEEHEAARWAHIPWPMWLAMEGVEQSGVVAHFRTHHKLQAVIETEEKRKGWLARLLGSKKGKP